MTTQRIVLIWSLAVSAFLSGVAMLYLFPKLLGNSTIAASQERAFSRVEAPASTAISETQIVVGQDIARSRAGGPASIAINGMEIVVGQDIAPSRMDAHSIAAIDAADMLEEKRDLNWFLAGQVDPVMPGHKPLPDLSRKLPVVDAENLQGGTDTLLANLRNPPIRFEVLSDTLDASSQRYLKHLAKMLVKHPSIRALIIEGHTDNQNRLGTNLPLSEKRAQAVKRMLEQQGVAGSKLIAIGYGHSQPVADNETAEGRARNRRIVFKLDAAP